MSSAKGRLFSLGLNELTTDIIPISYGAQTSTQMHQKT